MPRKPRPTKPTAVRPPTVKAIKAKCKECTNGYADGRHDCGIPTCSLYYFMPYRTATPEWRPEPKKRELTTEQRAAISAHLVASRSRSKHNTETQQTEARDDQEG